MYILIFKNIGLQYVKNFNHHRLHHQCISFIAFFIFIQIPDTRSHFNFIALVSSTYLILFNGFNILPHEVEYCLYFTLYLLSSHICRCFD